MSDQSVEEWARTTRFGDPVKLGDVEKGVLAREPVSAPAMPWWMPIMTLVGWSSLGIGWTLGFGLPILGLLSIWIGRDDAGGNWWRVAQMIFVVSALTQASLLYHHLSDRRREAIVWVSAMLTVAASAGAYVLVRSADSPLEPWPLRPGIVLTGVLTFAILVVTLRSKPHTRSTRMRPPLRGPRDDDTRNRLVLTRERVLDILSERGLVKIDEADRQRLREMPLGYWEELDGVDERERRRILEYRFVGWREFDESDRRAWPPPVKRR